MNGEIFNARLADWQAMPGDIALQEYYTTLSDELSAKFEVLSALYLEADNEQRVRLEQVFLAQAPDERSLFFVCDHLLVYGANVAGRIVSESDTYPLLLALAAVAMVQRRYIDIRDFINTLGYVYRVAILSGIDPTSYFEQIAATTTQERGDYILYNLNRAKAESAAQPEGIYPIKVLKLAQEEAQRLNSNYISTEHLLLGILRVGFVIRMFKELGLDVSKVRAAVETTVDTKDNLNESVDLYGFNVTRQTRKVFRLLFDLREQCYSKTCAEVALFGLIHEGTSRAAEVLRSLGVGYEHAREAAGKVSGYLDGPRRGSSPVLRLAYEEARRLNFNCIGTTHLLLGTLQVGVMLEALKELDVDVNAVRTAVETTKDTSDDPSDCIDLYEFKVTRRTRKVFLSSSETRYSQASFVNEAGLLVLAILLEGTSIYAGVLRSFGIGLEQLETALQKINKELA